MSQNRMHIYISSHTRFCNMLFQSWGHPKVLHGVYSGRRKPRWVSTDSEDLKRNWNARKASGFTGLHNSQNILKCRNDILCELYCIYYILFMYVCTCHRYNVFVLVCKTTLGRWSASHLGIAGLGRWSRWCRSAANEIWHGAAPKNIQTHYGGRERDGMDFLIDLTSAPICSHRPW